MPSKTSNMPGSSANRTLVLTYHAVWATREEWRLQASADRWYSLIAEEFEAQLTYLKDQGSTTPLLRQFLHEPSAKKSVILTFDDGHESNFRVVFPLLQRFGFRAEFFVTAMNVDKPGYMTWQQLRELVAAGMSVQSHGMHHMPLTGMDGKALKEELQGSKARIEKGIGSPVNYFSVPGGFADSRIYNAVLEAGYEALCNSEPGIAAGGRILPRVAIMHSTAQPAFEALVQRKRWPLLRMTAQREFGKAAKAILGVERYEKMKSRGMAKR